MEHLDILIFTPATHTQVLLYLINTNNAMITLIPLDPKKIAAAIVCLNYGQSPEANLRISRIVINEIDNVNLCFSPKVLNQQQYWNCREFVIFLFVIQEWMIHRIFLKLVYPITIHLLLKTPIFSLKIRIHYLHSLQVIRTFLSPVPRLTPNCLCCVTVPAFSIDCIYG